MMPFKSWTTPGPAGPKVAASTVRNSGRLAWMSWLHWLKDVAGPPLGDLRFSRARPGRMVATYRRDSRYGWHPDRAKELDERVPIWRRPLTWNAGYSLEGPGQHVSKFPATLASPGFPEPESLVSLPFGD